MPIPGWLRWMLAVAMIAVALYHLARLAADGWRRVRPPASIGIGARVGVDDPIAVDVELTHAAMGTTMTVMMLDAVAPAGVHSLALAFLVALLWFAARTVHGYATAGRGSAGISARQVIGCAAMAYMLLVLTAPSAAAGHMTGAMGGMSMAGAGSSVLTTLSSPLFRVLVAGATVGAAGWTIARMRVRAVASGPAVSLGCQLAVSATTVFMLVAM